MDRKTVNPSRELIKKLSSGLKSYVRTSFEEAKNITHRNSSLNPTDENYVPADILSLQYNFIKELEESDKVSLSEVDSQILKLYIPALKESYQQRLITFLMTGFLVKFTDAITWMNIWYNHEQGQSFSIKTIADRKSVTSEDTKQLLKSTKQIFEINSLVDSAAPPHLRDLFRLTCICSSDVTYLKKFVRVVMLILTNSDSEEHLRFFNWVENNTQKYGHSRIPKEALMSFKKYKFKPDHEKNRIDTPKGAFQSLQLTLTISETPEEELELLGKDFELKVQTWEMYRCSKIGDASQDDYKREIYELTRELFPLDGYEQEFFCDGLDENGLDEHVPFYQRQSSRNTIQKNN